MDLYNNDSRVSLALAKASHLTYENSHAIPSISSEPLDRYINELRSDLKTELKGIANISWR